MRLLYRCAASLFIVSISMLGKNEAAPGTEAATAAAAAVSLTTTQTVTAGPGPASRTAVTVDPAAVKATNVSGNGTDMDTLMRGGINLAYCLHCIENCQSVGNALEYCEYTRCASICIAGGKPIRPPPTEITTQGVIRPPPVTRPPVTRPPVTRPPYDDDICSICQG